jgi:hypothetical protein
VSHDRWADEEATSGLVVLTLEIYAAGGSVMWLRALGASLGIFVACCGAAGNEGSRASQGEIDDEPSLRSLEEEMNTVPQVKEDPPQLSETLLVGIDEGFAAFQRGDYATALRGWLPAAEAGDPESQANVAALYLQGLGVERDPERALQFLRAAGSQGNDAAASTLGLLYIRGDVVPQNPNEAMRWWRRAAHAGNPVAQYNLAARLANGATSSRDAIEAYIWFALAVASYQALTDGPNAVPEEITAFRKFHQEAVDGRDALGSSLDSDEIDRAHRLIEQWLERRGQSEWFDSAVP